MSKDLPTDRSLEGVGSSYVGPLCVLSSLFFMWGFITSLNDILIPHLKAVFTLTYVEVMLVQSCFFTAYFIMSIPCGHLVKRIDYKRGIIGGLALAGCGCLLFYPAASLRLYALFLAALFVLASGITLLQVAANPYVTMLGSKESASGRLTLTQAFNSLGTTLGPIFGAVFILSRPVKSTNELRSLDTDALIAYQVSEASHVQVPYLALAAILFLLALMFALMRLPKTASPAHSVVDLEFADLGAVWRYPQLLFGTLAIFTYVGGEVAIGSFLVSFLSEPSIAGLSPQEAGKWVSSYWGGAMVGRFIGAALLRRIIPSNLLFCAATGAALLVTMTLVSSGRLAMGSLLAVGLFNSIMFPTIFSMALHGLGRYVSQGAGILCTAIVGGAIVPMVQGVLADQIGVHLAFIVPLFCYLYIGYYAWHYRAYANNKRTV